MTRTLRIWLSVLSLAAVVGLVAALPYIVGVNWDGVRGVLGELSAGVLAGLVVLWLAGLGAYTFVLTASLPRLTHLRAFILNAAGSAVSNVLPLGGAAGVAVTYGMCRSWGHRPYAIMVSTLVTGVWNVLARLLLPALGIAALLVAHEVPDRRLAVTAGAAGAGLLAVAGLLVLVLRSAPAATWTREVLLRLADRLPRLPAQATRRVAGSLPRVRHATIDVLRGGWPRLTFGMIGYLVLQAALLVACLGAVGAAGIGLAETVAVFALNRALTTAVVTPSGAGVSEMGTAALLVHFGAPAAPAAAAVVLYMFFTYAVEIPLGGLAGGLWTLTRRRRAMP
ncbi:MAG TPA: lysylphosphatidylglycerol synthase domain-containing protein [Streptosporangiaceae bacterium]|nr:lysylphosphatidylglycerol synthase domain-containing protein [Streptosporangiaceae bacterium]